MALADPPGHVLDLGAVTDVALLGLDAELRRDAFEALASPCEEDAAPAALDEVAGDRLADPARPPGDDR